MTAPDGVAAAITAATTALWDSEHTSRLSEHPEAVAKYRKRAAKFVHALGYAGWAIEQLQGQGVKK